MVYDAAADFSPSNNPNGVWSYGVSTTLGGSMSLYTSASDLSGMDFWNNSGVTWDPPWVGHNGTGSPINFSSVTVGPGQLGFHPGANGEISIVRFTAPAAGQYALSSSFSGLDHVGPTTTGVHVLLNGASIFDGAVNGFGPGSGPSFATTLTLAAGNTVDFAVDFGTDGTYNFDSTGLSAKLRALSPIPEPSTLVTAGAGVVAGLAWRWRRRRAP
jgi:hypothetical protein